MYTRARVRSGSKPFNLDRPYILGLLHAALRIFPFMVCGGATPNSASIDRIDSKLGYVKGNIRIIPNWWNYAKHTWTDEQLFAAMSEAGWVKR